MNEWIPVSERLPEKNEIVLTFVDNTFSFIDFEYLCLVQDRLMFSENGDSVTHWMPLPKPPESQS